LVDLVDANGDIVISGAPAGELESLIQGYTATTSGAYYLHVNGDAGVEYNVLVLRNAAFSEEPNNTLGTAHDITQEHAVIGFVGASTEEEGLVASAIVTPPVPISVPVNLNDGAAFLWDIQQDGDINNGSIDA